MEVQIKDLVSVIMPAYNCEQFIADSIESLLAQTYKEWEVIIIDDFSTDKTALIIKTYLERDTRIKYVRLEKNSGAAVARNKAIDLARGEYIAFLDSDDIWVPEKLNKQISFMKKNKYNFTCTSYTKIDEEGNSLNLTIKANNKSDYNDILKNCPGNSTVIYNAENLGKFSIPDIKKRNDYVMWLKVIKKEEFLYGITESLGSHRIRKNAISSNKFSLVGYHWEVYREIESLSFLKSVYLITFWIFKSIYKK